MTVKELINKLEEFNSNAKIMIETLQKTGNDIAMSCVDEGIEVFECSKGNIIIQGIDI